MNSASPGCRTISAWSSPILSDGSSAISTFRGAWRRWIRHFLDRARWMTSTSSVSRCPRYSSFPRCEKNTTELELTQSCGLSTAAHIALIVGSRRSRPSRITLAPREKYSSMIPLLRNSNSVPWTTLREMAGVTSTFLPCQASTVRSWYPFKIAVELHQHRVFNIRAEGFIGNTPERGKHSPAFRLIRRGFSVRRVTCQTPQNRYHGPAQHAARALGLLSHIVLFRVPKEKHLCPWCSSWFKNLNIEQTHVYAHRQYPPET